MRLLLSTIGSRGEAQPVTALAVQLKELGNDVRVVAPPDFEDLVTGNGIGFTPVGPVLRTVTAVQPKPEDLGRLAEESVREQFRVVSQAAQGADVLVAGGALQHATRSVAESVGARYVYASFCANTLPSPHHAPPAMLGRVPVNGTPEENLAQWEQHRQLFAASREVLNAERAKLGLDPVDDVRDHIFGDAPWLAADPVLGPWPGPGELVQTGAWLIDDQRPLAPELDAFLAGGEPPIYFGLGSMRGAQDAAHHAIAAARELGRRVVLQQGWAGLRLADDAPDCIAIGEVNQQALFRRVAVVVHHGGAGTTTTAAAAGTPQVVLPHMYDQYYWGSQVERLNIGRSAAAVTTEVLAKALQLHEEAAEVGTQVRTDGAKVAAERLQRIAGVNRAN
ncbi:glycosyltransferase [Lentzea flava]|uniref:Glycosyl transferase n=1 Tax=Lentzea flava TaxID=103732 RepID=A0ABQ2VBG3_9PSEU|nr:glycosyltransferase [Lentzea flava]MCP2204460.1 UDP:flavonoid glycosyltransferase YjiC, YdhE family [Lentzea flava]GGU78273.1 glycosyl transferase [Lentzea flava]